MPVRMQVVSGEFIQILLAQPVSGAMQKSEREILPNSISFFIYTIYISCVFSLLSQQGRTVTTNAP